VLYQTPQAEGGCQDCEFWLACYGHCGGSGIDRDWRSRSVHCAVLKVFYREAERRLLEAGILPISRRPNRKELEATIFTQLHTGQPVSVYQLLHPTQTRPTASTPTSTHKVRHIDSGHLDHMDTDLGQ
jgi:uncharacterized protein